MKTRLFTLFTALTMGAAIIMASDTQVDGIWYNFDNSTNTAQVTFRGPSVSSYSDEYAGSVTIPSSVTYDNITYDVTSIDAYTFYRCANLTSVSIPNSITNIGYDAFRECTRLSSVTLPNSVTNIGFGAFYGCTGLKSPIYNMHVFAFLPTSYSGAYVIPNGIESIIGYAFFQCTELTSIEIPNSVTSIGQVAFSNCTSLTDVTIPESVTQIGAYAFAGCRKLKSITIPDKVTTINANTFAGCYVLTSVNMPNNVTSIGNQAFCDCYALKSITIPNSIVTIGNSAFSGCKNLTSVTIPDGILTINASTFKDCYALASINIPNSTTSIGDGAFSGCTGLTSTKIPNSVTNIGGNAFLNVPNIVYEGSATGSPWGARNINGYVEGWFVYSNEYKTNLTACFTAATGIISIPNSVISVEKNAFYDCKNISSITIPNSVTCIGDFAFANCSNLTTIAIGNSVKSIGNFAFNNCAHLTSINWNANKYPDCTNTLTPFYNSGSKYDIRPQLASFIIGDSVENVPAYLCNGMENLTELSIGNSVLSIANYAFAGLTNRGLNKIVLPNSLTTIGNYAFSGDSYIESIYFGPSLESIGSKAFDGCTRVATMTCLANVTPTVGTNGLESINSNATLYVPSSCLQKYKVDANWNRFIIEPLGTSDVLDPGTDVSVIADDNSAIFTWPTNASAQSYTLVLTKDGETVCTLTFNGNGQLAGISFAPPNNSQVHMPSAIMTAAGMQFTVTGLSYATNYEYALTVKDGSSNILASYSGSFGTTGAPQAIENVSTIQGEPAKLLRDGQILILRGDRTYILAGQEVK